jgi:outer membrane protein OmpU
MKKVLFATTAFAALAVGGSAMADITLYGSARLGLYYNDDLDNELQTTSRTRFGVTMSGETDSGITFGADMRADQVVDDGIDTADDGRAGEAFVSGAFGTLTFGDTNGADEQWVGDLVGDLSLTGLEDYDETAFISNGGNAGNDDAFNFGNNPDARPTVRYDFDIAGFGLSLSADSRLSDVGVGTGYSGPIAGFDLNIGLGYYNFEEFTFQSDEAETTLIDVDPDPLVDDIVEVPTANFAEVQAPGGEQYTAMLGFGAFGADMNVIYNNINFNGDAELETIGVGAEYTFQATTVGAFYRNALKGSGAGLDDLDGEDVWGVTAEYDLGGGAVVSGGVVQDYGDAWTGDFGINMSF